MARPAPRVLLSRTDEFTGTEVEILAAAAVYVIMYQGQHIGIRALTQGLGERCMKYKKVSFNHRGSAERVVRQLNTEFNTADFSYIKIGTEDEITFE